MIKTTYTMYNIQKINTQYNSTQQVNTIKVFITLRLLNSMNNKKAFFVF